MLERCTELAVATWDTVAMVFVATTVAVCIGLALGIATACTAPQQLRPMPWLHRGLSTLLNVGRSVPFLVLMVAMMPATRALVGTSIGLAAAIVPLAVAAIPFYGRLAQLALQTVDPTKLEMGRSLGASDAQLVVRVLLSEARVPLTGGIIMTAVALVSYSAMAGVVGGGGLGDLAIRYGYQRFDAMVMLVTTGIMVALVQVIQSAGDRLLRRMDKRL